MFGYVDRFVFRQHRAGTYVREVWASIHVPSIYSCSCSRGCPCFRKGNIPITPNIVFVYY